VTRWRIFRKPIIATTCTAIRIVKATTVLHNFIINSEAQLPPRQRQYQVINDRDNLISTGLVAINHVNNDRNMAAMQVRNTFAEYFENVEPLRWQLDKILSNNF